jgi:nicotinamide phosphoribosyltransferase
MKRENFVLLADAYKYAHHKLYYPGTTKFTATWKAGEGCLMKPSFLVCNIF